RIADLNASEESKQRRLHARRVYGRAGVGECEIDADRSEERAFARHVRAGEDHDALVIVHLEIVADLRVRFQNWMSETERRKAIDAGAALRKYVTGIEVREVRERV